MLKKNLEELLDSNTANRMNLFGSLGGTTLLTTKELTR
jgi:hypothetical protein